MNSFLLASFKQLHTKKVFIKKNMHGKEKAKAFIAFSALKHFYIFSFLDYFSIYDQTFLS